MSNLTKGIFGSAKVSIRLAISQGMVICYPD